MAEQHLSELNLLDVALSDASRAALDHVEACDECRAAVAQLAAGLKRPGQERALEVADRRAAYAPIPPRDPAAGDVWRATWDDIAQLVIVLAVDEDSDTVKVAAVGELDAADDESIPIDEQVLGWPAAALLAVQATIPIRTLDMLHGDSVPLEAQDVAEPVVSATDLRALEHATFHENLAHLAEATWVPTHATGSLTEQLRAMWPKPSQLALALDIGNTEARELIQGTRAPTPTESALLAALGVEASRVAPPPVNAIWAIDRPQFRQRWRDLARTSGVSEADYRWTAYTDGQFALAARRTGAGTSSRETWLGKISEVLRGLA